jgi:hypothetical protein
MIVNLLCDAGAHLDYANAFGQTPVDLATMPNTYQLLRSKMNLSLKCLCARLIRKKNVLFQGKIGATLVSFVEKH